MGFLGSLDMDGRMVSGAGPNGRAIVFCLAVVAHALCC